MANKIKSRSPIEDARKNEVVANAVVDDYPKEISAAVGIHALGRLSEMMPHEEFVEFIEAALHHSMTGEMPPQPDRENEQSENQSENQTASPAPETA